VRRRRTPLERLLDVTLENDDALLRLGEVG